MPTNIVDILHHCELFSEVATSSFRRLVTIGRLCHFRKGQLIFRENDPCPGVFVVGTGQVRVFKTGSGGREHILHIIEPGGTFAEVAAIGGFSLPASAEAIKKTTCVLLPLERFRQTMDDDHELCRGIMASTTVWVRRLITQIEDITLRDAAGRLARYLLDLAKTAPDGDRIVQLPGLKRHLASHLNLTGETFSRTLRRMVEAQLIEQLGGDRVRLLHPRQLRQVAEGLFPKL